MPYEIEDVQCIAETIDGDLRLDTLEHYNPRLPYHPVPTRAIHPTSDIQKVGDEGRLVVFDWYAIQQKWYR